MSDVVEVSLTKDEVRIFAQVGVQRRVRGMFREAKANQDCGRDKEWDYDIRGALAEAAVAKWTGLWAASLHTATGQNDPDVGDCIQVKSTYYPQGRLLIQRNAPDDALFVLVLTHAQPTFYIPGWTLGRFAKQDKFWDQGRCGQTFAVPQNLLYPPPDLFRYLDQLTKRVTEPANGQQ